MKAKERKGKEWNGMEWNGTGNENEHELKCDE